MMETLSKTELVWIYNALRENADKNARLMVENPADSVEYQLANMARENAKATMRKIQNVIDSNSKRIAIK